MKCPETGEPLIEIILGGLHALGYHASYRLMKCEEHGVPQIRRRGTGPRSYRYKREPRRFKLRCFAKSRFPPRLGCRPNDLGSAHATHWRGMYITCDLPTNALIDLDSICCFFKGSTVGTGGVFGFPVNLDGALFERVEVEINGTVIGGAQLNHYNQLFEMVTDLQLGSDVVQRRQILQNAGLQYLDLAAVTGTAKLPQANVTDQQFCAQTFLGFISGSKSRVIDSSSLAFA
ncbi:hypothetical protein WJX72_004278 [[Myrmecia] bisecta]|uniref:Uncharacterized protein n=1 Tax=[Myrmecia] bisecta TaxID=41462 RepID=A0AAW1PXN4_9CHLO